ncbi:MAG: HAD family hydrolase [Treponema sp.]|jgi:phosphoglycolate phosphatase/putative hydrolase of the HAD superfamily|nr:HAD family hydrolase [Treponema sp.]
MKIYRLPEKPKALLFDMDMTLYSHPVYAQSQVDTLLVRLAVRYGKTFEEMKKETDVYRSEWAKKHGGETISLSKVILDYGVSMAENIRWREEDYKPELYLKPDPRLRETLERLARSYKLAVVTNNTVSIALRTFGILGTAEFFPSTRIVGLDTLGIPKPHKSLYLKAAEILEAEAASCVSIGDRYDIDLLPSLEAGMGAILVDGVEDVYNLEDSIRRIQPS